MNAEPFGWRAGDRILECGRRTLVMGVLNVTPDSFSDGGRLIDPELAVAAGIRMVADGADLLDVGGESTRPGAEPVSVEEELERVLPVVKRLAAEVGVPVSVDTRKPSVAEGALDAGATIVNDISGGADPGMFGVVRAADAGLVLMHMRGDPATMQEHTDYADVVADVRAELAARVDSAVAAGIAREHLCIDPGIGFAKTAGQNLLLLRDIDAFAKLGLPVLIGPSRKSFIGRVLGTAVDERLEGTAAAVAWLVARRVDILRVHDVREMVRVARVIEAIRDARPGEEPTG